ncbi:MAG TPA: ribonuclease P protein component [Bordetella sp.]|nr:ribonuclease P protein component [Bordetella sp.]
MPRTTLPPEARMHRPSEFAAALKGRRLARGAFFMITTATAPAGPEQGRARLGMVIAKRHAARAATRNALKRVIREAFRARRLALPHADYVVRLHVRVPELSLTALKHAARAEVDTHFDRLARRPS